MSALATVRVSRYHRTLIPYEVREFLGNRENYDDAWVFEVNK